MQPVRDLVYPNRRYLFAICISLLALLLLPGITKTYVDYSASAAHSKAAIGAFRTPDFNRISSTRKGNSFSSPVKLGSTPPPVNWDEQLGLTIAQDEGSLSYNVTAVEQTDSNGYGPGYLLNGLTDKGDWYQVGLAYNWPLDSGGYASGFSFLYEVFNTTGGSVYPTNGGGGLANYSKIVNPGDQVFLSLSFVNSSVQMFSKDWNTGAIASASYSSFGGAIFIGLQTANNQNGYFSGLMTEDYHVQPYLGTEAQVVYSDPSLGLDSATMWIDEYNPYSNQTLFAGSTPDLPYSNPDMLLSYSLNGTTVASDAFEFITGSNLLVPITMSYSVVGGGTNYLAPKLSFFSNGIEHSTTLTTTPTAFFMDQGTTWFVTNPLNGSTSSEQWITTQSNGTVGSSQTISLTFVHEFMLSFGVTPHGSGSIFPVTAGWYPAGTLTLNATAISPFLFSNWDSNSSSIQFTSFTSAVTTAKVEGSGNITARFSTVALSLSSYSESVTEGSSVANTADVIGKNVSISLSVSGLPSGATVKWGSPNVIGVAAGSPDNFTIDTTLATQAGIYNVTLIATSGNSTNSVKFVLTIGLADALTVGYSVSDGSSISPPTITYVYNGTFVRANLSSIPSTIYADNGSSWMISSADNNSLMQRWIGDSPTQGMASGPATIEINYYHQFMAGFSYGVANNVTAPGSLPSVTITSEGSRNTIPANGTMLWVDAGSSFNFSSFVSLSNADRLKIFRNQTGTVNQSTIQTAEYIQEYLVNASYTVQGGISLSWQPKLTITGANSSVSTFALNQTGSRYWVAPGSSWTATENATMGTTERWIGTFTTGLIEGASTIRPSYSPQYYVSIGQNDPSGGAVTGKAGWYGVNSSIPISAAANQGWKFESWTGSVGNFNQSSLNIDVSGPVNETAIFYPGLSITPASNGHISYSYGRISGTAPGGSTTTLYLPLGTNVSFSASSDSTFYSAGSWSAGNYTSSGSQYGLTLLSPASISVTFALNLTIIALIAAIVTGIGGSAAYVILRRGGGGDFGDGSSHGWKW